LDNEKTAMVGTPCQILAATKINKYREETGGSPIDVKIGLFCMENFSYTYLKKFLKDHNIEIADVKGFRIEENKFKVFLKNNDAFIVPLSETESFKRKNCDICIDYTSDISDISIGSVGSPKGWSTVIIRTEKGKKIVENAEKEGYFQTKTLTEKGKKLLEIIAKQKKQNNLKKIIEREMISRPVLFKRGISDEEIGEISSKCQFENLESDVISEGACVLCGACEYVCPTKIIGINDRKPQKYGECEEDCHACYYACPRTYLSEEIVNYDVKKPLGSYLNIISVKSNKIKGQDGAAVTSILIYLLEKGLVDKVSIIGEDEEISWKPVSKLTAKVEDVINAAGTKYSTVPIGFKALE
jgi:coenzyme F420 hydrogenase subunit beta